MKKFENARMTKMVADQNLFNSLSTGVRAQLTAKPDLHLIIPDVALVEMCKGLQWDLTMQLALSPLRGYEDRIELAAGIGELLNQELTSRKAINTDDLLPSELQEVLRTFVGASVTGSAEEARALLRKHVETTQADVEVDLLDAEEMRRNTSTLASTWSTLPAGVLKALASSKTESAVVSAFVQVEATALARRVAEQDLGLSQADATTFLAEKPLVLRRFLAVARHTLNAARHGLGALPAASKELNNRLDLEYGIIATYFDGLLTLDVRAKEAYDCLREMLDCPLEEAVVIRNAWLATLRDFR